MLAYLSSSATTAASMATTTKTPGRQDTSGLTPVEVGLTLAVLLGIFVLLLFIGGLCKVFNKPRKEARPYVTGQAKLFQPSAAGYGTRVAGLKVSEANNIHGSRVSLLAGASPMGQSGTGESSFDTPHSSGQDYFGRAGHSRGQSTGISLPGATAASNRRGGPHPPIQGNSIAPDGSGFKPGQIYNHSSPATSPGPSGYASRPNGMGPPGMEANQKVPSNVGMGPPPAVDSRRRSRYARADGRRIDSVGPGVIRKSMFLGPGDEGINGQDGMPRSTSSNLRRVDSVGKGDPRRKSTYQDPGRKSRSASIYNNGDDSQYDNFGAGMGGDPLGAKSVDSLSPHLKARSTRGMQFESQQMAMPPIQRQYSNGPSPGFSNGGPPIEQTMAQQSVGAYSLPPGAGYPGGGAPRMRPNQSFASMAGAYERGTRQIV